MVVYDQRAKLVETRLVKILAVLNVKQRFHQYACNFIETNRDV